MYNKSTFLNICLVTLTFIVGIIAINILYMSFNIFKYREANFYLIGKDIIPSIYKVNGKRNMYFYRSINKNNNDIKIFKYKKIEDVKSDLSSYINELRENYNYVYTSDIDLRDSNGSFELSTNSVEDNKIIIINIKYNENSYSIKITKGNGNLNFNK